MPNPPLPQTVEKRGSIKTINGHRLYFTVLDEITQVASNDPNKAIYLQKIKYEKNGEIVLRLAYYIIGRKGRTKGKWVWGQFATMMPAKDFKTIIRKATEKGWI